MRARCESTNHADRRDDCCRCDRNYQHRRCSDHKRYGPAHICAALNTPTLVVFGPTNPFTTYPLSRNAEILRHPPECAPWMLRECPNDHRCMTAITGQDI